MPLGVNAAMAAWVDRDLRIPWVVFGARLKSDVELVRIHDTAPTIAHLLGFEVPEAWRRQGRSVVE